MKVRNRAVLAALFVVGVVLLLASSPTAAAQDKSVRALSRDTTIRINTDGSFRVEEVYELEFSGGTFTYGFRKIPLNHFESLDDVTVSGDGVEYVQDSSANPGTYQQSFDGSEYTINYYYPPAQNEVRTFTVGYTIHGGIIINEEYGDRLYWIVIEGTRGYVVEGGTVTVILPDGAEADTAIEPFYEGAGATYEVSSDRSTVVYDFGRLADGQTFTVGVRFTHGVVPPVEPSWQAAFEREQEQADAAAARQKAWDEKWGPIASLAVGAISVLILIGGLLGVYLLYASKGRDPKVSLVPEYLSEPPSDLPPGVVGTLIDEKADLKDIIATLVDLARRGVFDMREEEKSIFGITKSRDFTFTKRDDFNGELRGYESELVRSVFGRKKEVTLDDLTNKFYSSIPKIQGELYEEVVAEELFPKSPKAVRGRWMAIGIGGIVLTFVGGFCGMALVSDYVQSFCCLPISLGLVSLAAVIASRAMPAKTRKGSEESAKWKAFRTYIKQIDSYSSLEGAADQFDRYLPFAIAFGLENSWISKFSRVDTTPIPIWYYPMGIPYVPGQRHGVGEGQVMGGLQGPSLQRMSDGFAGGLQSMSDGLVSMLNTTSSVLRSMPSSDSGSSGGGGFSSGGFSGGGGGGGSSGFG